MTGAAPAGPQVRLAGGDDLEAVLHIGRTTWPATYEPIAGADYVAMGLAKWWTPEANIPAIRQGRCFVAEVDGEVVGMATWGLLKGVPVVWKIYVLPEAQGHGLGHRLMHAIMTEVASDYDELTVSFSEGNEPTQRFYTNLGFVETHREPGNDPVPTQVFMRLDLRDEADRAESGGSAATQEDS